MELHCACELRTNSATKWLSGSNASSSSSLRSSSVLEKAGRTKTTNTSTCFLISEQFVTPNRDSFCGRHTNAHCSISHTHTLQGPGLRVKVLDKQRRNCTTIAVAGE